MSVVQIPNLPLAISIDGQESLEVVQGGVSRRCYTRQIADLGVTVTSAEIVDTIADLISTNFQTNTPVFVQGYYAIGDGGGGYYYGVSGAPAGTYVDNGGTIIVPSGGDGSSAWLLNVTQPISVKQFGAYGDGVTNDVVYFQNAINWTVNNQIEVIRINPGSYFGDFTTLTYGTRYVVWQEEGNVNYLTAAPNNYVNSIRQNTKVGGGDKTRLWSYGYTGNYLSYDGTGPNRPLYGAIKSADYSSGGTGNAGVVTLYNSVNKNSGIIPNGAIENCLVMQNDVYTNATSVGAFPQFGLIQGTMFKHNISQGSFIAANFVARDETARGSSTSRGSQVAMEIDVVASGPDSGETRLVAEVIARAYSASVDGPSSVYAGIRVRPSNGSVIGSEPMEIQNAFISDPGSLGTIFNHYVAKGACDVNGSHFEAYSDDTRQAIVKLGCQRSGAGNTITQIVHYGDDSAGNKTAYAILATQIVDPTNGSEGGYVLQYVTHAGASVLETVTGNGVRVGSATGSNLGTGSINAAGNTDKQFYMCNGAAGIYSGSGTPEAAVTAKVGSLFLRTDGGAGTTLYVKESGIGNTGWVAK